MKIKVFNKVRENEKFKLVPVACAFAFTLAIATPFLTDLVDINTGDNILEDSLMLVKEHPMIAIADVIFASAAAMCVLSVTDLEIITEEKYAPSILRMEDSEVESECAMQHVRLVNPIEIERSQKVLKKSM